MSDSKKEVKPFVIQHDEEVINAQSIMQASTVAPSPSEKEKKKKHSVVDDLVIDEKYNAVEGTKKGKNECLKNTNHKPKKKPFSILPAGVADPNKKLYLLLLYINNESDNTENEKDYCFIRGRQEVFDFIVQNLHAEYNIDCMKSLIYVDSPRVKISTRTSIYKFMKDMINTNKVINTTGFDIEDYYYDYEYEGRTEISDGEEDN